MKKTNLSHRTLERLKEDYDSYTSILGLKSYFNLKDKHSVLATKEQMLLFDTSMSVMVKYYPSPLDFLKAKTSRKRDKLIPTFREIDQSKTLHRAIDHLDELTAMRKKTVRRGIEVHEKIVPEDLIPKRNMKQNESDAIGQSPTEMSFDISKFDIECEAESKIRFEMEIYRANVSEFIQEELDRLERSKHASKEDTEALTDQLLLEDYRPRGHQTFNSTGEAKEYSKLSGTAENRLEANRKLKEIAGVKSRSKMVIEAKKDVTDDNDIERLLIKANKENKSNTLVKRKLSGELKDFTLNKVNMRPFLRQPSSLVLMKWS